MGVPLFPETPQSTLVGTFGLTDVFWGNSPSGPNDFPIFWLKKNIRVQKSRLSAALDVFFGIYVIEMYVFIPSYVYVYTSCICRKSKYGGGLELDPENESMGCLHHPGQIARQMCGYFQV